MTGVPELLKRLDAMSDDIKRKGGRAALGAAARVVRDAAKRNAQSIDDPATREDIEKNITYRFSSKLFRSTGNLGFRVGVQGGAGGNLSKKELDNANPGGDTRHWRYIEFGSENNQAHPFMVPALSQNVQKATDTFVATYDKKLTALLKKLGAN